MESPCCTSHAGPPDKRCWHPTSVRIACRNVNDMLAYPYENHRHRNMQHLHDAAHRNGSPPPRRSLPSPPYIIPNTTHFNFCPFAWTRKDNNKLVLHRSVRPLLALSYDCFQCILLVFRRIIVFFKKPLDDSPHAGACGFLFLPIDCAVYP